jgi:hypothetical protein
MLPTFSGNQAQYKVWSTKWRAYLGNMKNADGIPLLYVIVHYKKEKRSVRHQLKGASLKGSKFNTDNFKVSQLLESALADGSMSIFMTTHPGDGGSAYLDLDEQYAGSFRQETRVQEIMSKLKTLQYRGVKSFPLDKFTNVLLGFYDELETLHAKVDKRTQVREVINMISHERTRTIAAEIVATDKKAKQSLKTAMARIGERMQLLGAMTASNGDSRPPASNRQIKKLQRKIKAFQARGSGGGNKPGKDADGDFIPKAVLDALKKAEEATRVLSTLVCYSMEGRNQIRMKNVSRRASNEM